MGRLILGLVVTCLIGIFYPIAYIHAIIAASWWGAVKEASRSIMEITGATDDSKN